MELLPRSLLIIDGMFCAACAASVESALARHPDVTTASVNFAADAAVVQWRAGRKPAPATVIDTVRRLGYRARLVGDDTTGDAAAGSGQAGAERAGDPAPDFALRLAIAAFFGMWTMLPSIALYLGAGADPVTQRLLAWSAGLLSMPVVLYSGLPFYRMGIATLRLGVAGVDALVTLGVAGSLIVSGLALAAGSADVYFEVPVALITLQLIARLIDGRVRRRARDAISRLLALSPSSVTLEAADGSQRTISLAEVRIGDRVRLRPGERIAVDGRVVEGDSDIDRRVLTGESAPVPIGIGERVHAGERMVDGSVAVEVTASVGRRRIDRLARQAREFVAARPAWQRLADGLARRFLLIASALSALGFAIALAGGADAASAAVRALAVFVIACPCALSLAIPVAALGAASAAARSGMILRDLNVLTAATRPTLLFVDKTGTLTSGRPSVSAVHPRPGYSADEVLGVGATAERFSEHPLGQAIVAEAAARDVARGGGGGGEGGVAETAAARPAVPVAQLADDRSGRAARRTVAGGGVVFERSDGTVIRVGSARWLTGLGITLPGALPATSDTRVFVVCDASAIGAIDLCDPVRPGADRLVQQLCADGVDVAVLSGDADAPVQRVANALGIRAHAECSPEEKVALIGEARARGAVVAFAGDGINDSTALAAADIGIAVGGATDAARAAASVTLEDGDVTCVPALFSLCARTRRIIRQNLLFAVAYNVLAIPAALAGIVHPAIAALAMAGSSITVLANGWRAAQPPGASRATAPR